MVTQRIRLTAREISAILDVAGDALAVETLSSSDDPEGELEAFERGMDKLRALLARTEKKQ